jgi:hypothetical protein
MQDLENEPQKTLTSHWECLEDFRNMALLGLDRSHFPQESLASLQQIGSQEHQSNAHALLDGLASLYWIEKTAHFTTESGPLQPMAEAPDEQEINILSKDSIADFERMVSGVYLDLLPVFVQLCVEHKRRFPFRYLPFFLDRCYKNKGLLPVVKPLISPRAIWLMGLRPDWRILLSQMDESPLDLGIAAQTEDPIAAQKRSFFVEKMTNRLVHV